MAVSSSFFGDGSSASSRYNISGGLPEVAKALFGEVVAGGGGLSCGVELGEFVSVDGVSINSSSDGLGKWLFGTLGSSHVNRFTS